MEQKAPDELRAAATAVINAGHALTSALIDALKETDREKLSLLTTAGASIALTVRWLEERVEVRVGVVTDDSPPSTILALDYSRGAESFTPAH